MYYNTQGQLLPLKKKYIYINFILILGWNHVHYEFDCCSSSQTPKCQQLVTFPFQ